MPTERTSLPSHLYPAFAPLSVPMVEHLLLLEARQHRRRRPGKGPTPQHMLETVLQRVVRARADVYDYLRFFVTADKRRQERGESGGFPTAEWVLETLAFYAPNQVKYDEATLKWWQKRGLLRRERRRGLLDISSVATLFTVRLAENVRERNWLPARIEAEEPLWWCYGQESPDAPLRPVPLPLPAALPAALILCTPWQGAVWEQEWQPDRVGNLYRWARPPELEDLLAWDTSLPVEILSYKEHPLLGRPMVQQALLEEARSIVLTEIIKKGVVRHDRKITGDLFC